MSTQDGREPKKRNVGLHAGLQSYFSLLKAQAEATMNPAKEHLGLRNMRLLYLLQITALPISISSAVLAYLALKQTGASRVPQTIDGAR